MKRIFATSALTFALLAGSTALAFGPDHKHDHKHNHAADNAKEHAAKPAPKLEDFLGEINLPKLNIGSKAPELTIAKFVKGDAIEGFEAGQVYVVEFWATWCGPCIKAFPHLSKLQAELGDQVKIIGVNVWERAESQEARFELIEKFVEKQGDKMSYTVAIEDGDSMAQNWMKAAGQNGIPAAFIVDGTGHIAWVGHPAGIDEPLKTVIAGEFDADAALEKSRESTLVMAAFGKFRHAFETGEMLDEARQIAPLLVNKHLAEEPGGLNAIAWIMATSTIEQVGQQDYKLAYKASKMACEITEWKDWSLLDTHALAAFKAGKKDQAIKWQKKAIELTPASEERALEELKARLAEFES